MAAHEPPYPTLSQAVDEAKCLAECLQTGIADGDLLGHLKLHKKEFAHSTWVVAGYLREITIGMPSGVDPIGITAMPPEFISEWSKVEAEYAAEQGGLATAGPLDWITLICWLLQLLGRT